MASGKWASGRYQTHTPSAAKSDSSPRKTKAQRPARIPFPFPVPPPHRRCRHRKRRHRIFQRHVPRVPDIKRLEDPPHVLHASVR